MKRRPTATPAVIAYVAAALVVACTGDIETGIPTGFYASSGRAASNESGSGGVLQGTNDETGGTLAPEVGGASAATGGAGGSGGSSAAGAAGAGAMGGTPGATGGAGGVGGTATSAGKAGTGPASGGKTSAGAAGAAGRAGAGGTGLGAGGRGGAAGASAASGASGASGSAGTGSALFTPVGVLINKTCATADCHGGKERPSLSNTNPTTLYNTLKSTSVRQCGSDRLATPNDPANSALLELVQHQCGTFVMPDGCMMNPCISTADIATITAWIQAGAPAP